MAQININLNQEEILQLLTNDREGAFKLLLENSLNSILKAESLEQLKAEPYERSEDRTDSRNGTRPRKLNTRIGSITLDVPRHRNVPFKTSIFDCYQRSESALILTMAEMVVNGVSTRKVSKVMEELCDTPVSKSMVSEACKELDPYVSEFRDRPLKDDYPFIVVDATYFKVREKHRVISKAMMIALAVSTDGRKEILGFQTCENESKETWTRFLESLKRRGIRNVDMFTSDAHEGIMYAITKAFPRVPWQRCHYHFTKNIVDAAPKKYQEGLRSELYEMFTSENIKTARMRKEEIIKDYLEVAPKSIGCLDSGFEDAMTVMILPAQIRKYLRTSNLVERLNRELKRRSQVIGIFPNIDSLIRIMGSVLIEEGLKYEEQNRIFVNTIFTQVKEVSRELELIAINQAQQLDAA